ncbi:cytidine deaminase [Enterovirga sp.]|uniref:cytidine deaminase n=1 Tax=Enterovirga sp. TaxID=2026350 RepID=UPI002C0A393D|nr:cytidine deaminase [Enterovirga sp.]HMO27882.1 cytidine deaminase [Enterovirga sp.]
MAARPPRASAEPGAPFLGDPCLGDLLAAAAEARANAYAPYSQFPVGAAILDEDGRIFAGCNVENASYPVGTCAEAGAIAAMVAGGGRRLRAILILGGEAQAGLAPCGACRQRIVEFALPGALVHCAGPGGIGRTVEAADLLPHSFAARDLRP